MDVNMLLLQKLIEDCLNEDIGPGDLTTNSIVPAGAISTAYITAKEEGVLAGLPVALEVFRCLDKAVQWHPLAAEGEPLSKGKLVAEISGKTRAILTGERTALNFLQHLSGIATATAHLTRLVGEGKPLIVDTRKTTPGLRMLEKYAVRVGGGYNHRFGLYDAVLIKDNHISYAGGVAQAVSKARQTAPHTAKIEVEVADLEQLKEALASKADIIMLDNMSTGMMKEAVKMVGGKTPLEASGGITEERIKEIAEIGVDLISVGALTHSVKALDISLDLSESKTVIC